MSEDDKFDIATPPWGKTFNIPFNTFTRKEGRTLGYDIYLVNEIPGEKAEVARLREEWDRLAKLRDALPDEEAGNWTREEFNAGAMLYGSPKNASDRYKAAHAAQNEAYEAWQAARKSYYRASISLWGALMEVMTKLGCLVAVDRSGQPPWPKNIPDEYWEFEYQEGRWEHGKADINSPGQPEKLNRFHKIHMAIDAHKRWSAPGPVKGIPSWKMGGNDGYIVTAEEAFYAHSMIKAASPDLVDKALSSVDLDSVHGRQYWDEWVEYLDRATHYGGFEVR